MKGKDCRKPLETSLQASFSLPENLHTQYTQQYGRHKNEMFGSQYFKNLSFLDMLCEEMKRLTKTFTAKTTCELFSMPLFLGVYE